MMCELKNNKMEYSMGRLSSTDIFGERTKRYKKHSCVASMRQTLEDIGQSAVKLGLDAPAAKVREVGKLRPLFKPVKAVSKSVKRNR